MTSQTVLKGLRRVWKSIPLSTLNQGASLSIRSQLPVVSLDIVAQWRDDGHVEFQQKFDNDKSLDQKDVFLNVTQSEDRMTSLGRRASHVALDVRKEGTPSEAGGRTSEVESIHQIPLANEPKPISKVVLDDGSIHADGEEYTDLRDGTRRVEYHDGVAHITAEEENTDPAGIYLTVVVPEKINIDVRLEQGGDISIPNKIEGDVKLSTSDGQIKVKKLRGHEVNLESSGEKALIYATDTLEAQQLSIKTSGRIRAKQLHGSSMKVHVSHTDGKSSSSLFDPLEEDDEAALIDVSSLYVSGQGGASLFVSSVSPLKKAVRVKTSHGPVRLTVQGASQPKHTDPNTHEIYPLVELGGVNGNFELSMENTETDDAVDWKSCLVHIDSLSPDTVSLLVADAGDVSLTIDRKVESDVRLLSTSSRECLSEAGYILAEEEDSEMAMNVVRNIHPSSGLSSAKSLPEINIATKAFSARPGGICHLSHMQYVDGWVEDNSAEPPSRFDRKVRGETAKGKIDIDSAADQALHGFGDKLSETSAGGEEFPRPLLAVLGTGGIKVETVSWLGAIARRYGLDESGRDLGRQATRRGRPILPVSKSQ